MKNIPRWAKHYASQNNEWDTTHSLLFFLGSLNDPKRICKSIRTWMWWSILMFAVDVAYVQSFSLYRQCVKKQFLLCIIQRATAYIVPYKNLVWSCRSFKRLVFSHRRRCWLCPISLWQSNVECTHTHNAYAHSTTIYYIRHTKYVCDDNNNKTKFENVVQLYVYLVCTSITTNYTHKAHTIYVFKMGKRIEQ